jgi:hypothetical protein
VALVRILAAAAFVASALAGSIIDGQPSVAPSTQRVLAGDFHIHGMPGDGALPVWEIQREAERRNLDVIAITNHDDNLAVRLAERSGRLKPYPIVIPGQEVTSLRFHIAAIGVRRLVRSDARARDAIGAIHAQGGVAVAAHPVPKSWLDDDDEAIRLLDGVEVSHPTIMGRPRRERDMLAFFQRARALKPHVAPIGSTDFHTGVPLGVSRTYLIVNEVSEAGVLDAIRHGRAVASGPGERLIGAEEHLAVIRAHLRPPEQTGFQKRSALPAVAALVSLAVLILSDRRATPP